MGSCDADQRLGRGAGSRYCLERKMVVTSLVMMRKTGDRTVIAAVHYPSRHCEYDGEAGQCTSASVGSTGKTGLIVVLEPSVPDPNPA